ncbi:MULTISPECIES: hypothetical protein [Exiguobacterium]|uniref:DNA recombination protein RmuC n=1 Tax=Exiguobacterium antarcticum TaxID=132920 RepID=A0ABT6QZM1_9BACL|nr:MULTISPECIES: hypothetical protein [Exiguobacterium]AFS70001.1 Hypothetical protein Eab7_0857 [Exiguobacterium antarcticum B7]MCT4780077.1 hypothetical protein [Exiguobacterium soli]MDI3234129.1 hypothetical protein [Exiguobacterium antarcticum]
MIWINLGIIVLAIIGLVIYGATLYKKKISKDVTVMKQLLERFSIRQQTLQTGIDHTTSRIDQIKGNIDHLVAEGKRVEQGGRQLFTEGQRLKTEVEHTAGLKPF